MPKREVFSRDSLRSYIVCSLTIELSVLLSEIHGVHADTIIRRFARGIRRGNPGLLKAYVEEEVIRQMAKEVSCFSKHSRPGEYLEVLQLEIRNNMRANKKGLILSVCEYYFPLNEESVFASPKFRK